MREPFEIEWLGGAAEHHFRRARPEVKDVPWGTIRRDKYPPALLDLTRGKWTEVAINEYRAVASFTEVVRCLVDAKAPLDLIGMASDFLADEVLHVELASRVAMELGGGAPRQVDMDHFAARSDLSRTPFERANDAVVRVCCVSEAFAAGIGGGNHRASAHPLTRAVYEIVMADEARHRRLGSLYLEWAGDQMSDEERARLGHSVADAMKLLSLFWKAKPGEVRDGVLVEGGFTVSDLHELGWLESAKAIPLAREVAETHVLSPLAEHGIVLTSEERSRLLD